MPSPRARHGDPRRHRTRRPTGRPAGADGGAARTRGAAASSPRRRRCAHAREAIQQTRPTDGPPPETGPDWAAADADADPDDLDAEHQGLSSAELLQRGSAPR